MDVGTREGYTQNLAQNTRLVPHANGFCGRLCEGKHFAIEFVDAKFPSTNAIPRNV